MQLTLRPGAKGLEARIDHDTQTGTKRCLFVLSNNASADQSVLEGVPAEYMIVRQLGSHPTGFIVEPVTSEYELVRHKGFECAGSMCRTTASAIDHSRPTITPGRCENIMHIADNVNSRFNRQPDQPLQSGSVYIRQGEQRAAGLAHLEDVDFSRMAAASRYLNRCAAYEHGIPLAA